MHTSQLPAVALLITASSAGAFTLETVATDGCHERITRNALSRSGWPPGAVPPAPTPDDLVLAQNLQFHAPDNADAWTLALLLGVRDNDLEGVSPTDLPHLAAVQNGAGDQHDHCLRELGDKGSDGDLRALTACRLYILGELDEALGDGDLPDLQQTEPHAVDLAYSNPVLPLSRYPFHLGNASHALEDAFAHTFRTSDFHTVVSVLNYIGPNLDASYTPATDGSPHESAMDQCDDDDPAARARTEAATTAVSELYDALNRAGDRATRLQRVNAVLDRWLGYAPGCTSQNAWCGHVTPKAGCSAAGGVPALAAALMSLLRRRRRTAALAVTLLSCAASAQPSEPMPEDKAPAAVETPASQAPAPPADGVTGAAPANATEPDPRRWAVHVSTGISLDNPSAALTAGARLRVARRLWLGLDVELAPWLDPISGRAALGTADAFASALVVWTQLGPVDLRSTVSAGTSILLFDAEGGRAGSIGLFVGTSPVQLALHVTERLSLELAPEVMVAVPALKGVPLAYRQYRATCGLQWLL
jgi:uncharacterized protein (TIGR03382 family)